MLESTHSLFKVLLRKMLLQKMQLDGDKAYHFRIIRILEEAQGEGKGQDGRLVICFSRQLVVVKEKERC